MPKRRAFAFVGGLVALLLAVAIASNAAPIESTSPDNTPASRSVLAIESELRDTASTETSVSTTEPAELPDWVGWAVASIFIVGALYLLSRQRWSWRPRKPTFRFQRGSAAEVTSSSSNADDDDAQADAIAAFASDLINELQAGDSPRHAIQQAYAAVETGFGATELVRKPAETPLRYLDRIFGRHSAMKQPLGELTDLFQHARFSPEPVHESMRTDAIAALHEIHDYYRQVGARRAARRRSTAGAR